MKNNGNRTEILATILILLAFVQTIFIINAQSPVLDEQFYPGAARYTVQNHDFTPFAYRFHPPLAYYINSLFLYFDHSPVWSEKPFDMGKIANTFGVDYFLFITRLPIALTSLVLGGFIFLWTRQLYGDNASLFSLALFSFEPTILAHSSVATTDMVAATFIFISMYFFWRFSKNITVKYSIASGIFLGLAFMSKTTALILIPVTLILFFFYFKPLKKNFRTIALFYILAFVTVWAFYGFEVSTINNTVHSAEKADVFINGTFNGTTRYMVNLAVNTPLPAVRYLTVMGYNFYHSSVGHGSYLFGSYSQHGWLYYYVLAFLIKSTIPLILIILIFAALLLSRLFEFRKDDMFIILPIFLFFIVLSALSLNIGIRHLLPAYPFLFVILGKIINTEIIRKRPFQILLLALVIWTIVEAVMITPYNISYFNEFAGGPKNGYLYLSDTDVDWGQWLKYVSSYSSEKNISQIYLTPPMPRVFMDYYIKNYTKAGCEKKNGVYAVGVSSIILYSPDCYRWLRNYTPYDMIGYSVLVYNITNVQ